MIDYIVPGGGWGGRGFEFVLSIYDIYRYPMGTIYYNGV